jgi:hypothetical protein
MDRCPHCGSLDLRPAFHAYARAVSYYGWHCRNCGRRFQTEVEHPPPGDPGLGEQPVAPEQRREGSGGGESQERHGA